MQNRKPFRINRNILFALVFALLGCSLLILATAATPVASIEPEAGTLGSGATITNATSASSGKAIKFSAASTGQGGNKCADLTNLAFCDDFDTAANTAPDSTKWRILGGSSWGGQCFKNLRENLATDGQGNLKMTLLDKGTNQCTDSNGYPSNITSSGMDTQNKKYFRYGNFEIRAKFACAQSVWGAIWTSVGTGPVWPEGGEIDIYESFHNDGRIKNSIHAGNPHWTEGRYIDPGTRRFCEDFHTYGLIWRPGSIKYTLDGVVKNQYTTADAAGRPWPFDTYDQRLIIDLQYGGPGRPNAGTYDVSELPSSMLIDYVHIFN
ncbi:glycoside hydrolase family 16 protein [Aeromicrobium sp.]|nr:glycoside hydrolase family 16 protein [Candidatus Saccharibacteria bacterium]